MTNPPKKASFITNSMETQQLPAYCIHCMLVVFSYLFIISPTETKPRQYLPSLVLYRYLLSLFTRAEVALIFKRGVEDIQAQGSSRIVDGILEAIKSYGSFRPPTTTALTPCSPRSTNSNNPPTPPRSPIEN